MAALSATVAEGGTAGTLLGAGAGALATSLASLAQKKRSETAQRARLEQLRREVGELQKLQQLELQVLQSQMNGKAQEFSSAWEQLQDDLSREAQERSLLQNRLVASVKKVRGAGEKGVRVCVFVFPLALAGSGP